MKNAIYIETEGKNQDTPNMCIDFIRCVSTMTIQEYQDTPNMCIDFFCDSNNLTGPDHQDTPNMCIAFSSRLVQSEKVLGIETRLICVLTYVHRKS